MFWRSPAEGIVVTQESASIAKIEPASQEAWLAACHADASATYFHTPYWAGIFSEYHGGALVPCAQRLTFDDGSSAIVPLARSRRLGGAFVRHYSTAPGTYGGSVTTASGGNNAAPIVRHLNSLPNICWQENPFDASMVETDIPGSRDQFTQVIDLRRPLEAIYAAADRAQHKALRKAQREGVTARIAESEADWSAYHDLYLDSLRRWRTAGRRSKVVYSRELFGILRRRQGENIRLWLAEKEGAAVSGMVCLYWNHHMVTWHGAARAELFWLRPNNLLYWEAICDAHRREFWWFDCNPSGGNRGVETFKEYLGARRMRVRVVDRRSRLLKGILALRSLV
jgi:hypothetical protein